VEIAVAAQGRKNIENRGWGKGFETKSDLQ